MHPRHARPGTLADPLEAGPWRRQCHLLLAVFVAYVVLLVAVGYL